MKRWMLRGWLLPLGLYVGTVAVEFVIDMAYLYFHPQTQIDIARSVGSVTVGFKPESWFFMLSGGLFMAVGIASLYQRITVLKQRERYELGEASGIGVLVFGMVFDFVLIAAMGMMMTVYAVRL